MNSGLETLLQYDLTELIETMFNYVDFIDNSYQNANNNKIMRYWQSRDVTLKSILLIDLLDWLCCLAFSDGFIAPEEVKFINSHLKQTFSDNDIIDLCKFRINEDYFNHLPLSFILLYEHDLVMKSLDRTWDFNSVENLHKLYSLIGFQFIHCDNDVDLKELKILNEYTEDLSNRIHDFDLIQQQLSILEASNWEFAEEYSENRYPFNQDIINEYNEELSRLNNIEEFMEDISKEDNSFDINISPDYSKSDDIQNNPDNYGGIKTNSSWDLEKNLNDYYNFTGEFDNHLDTFKDIFTQENREKLQNSRLTTQQYRCILNKIKSTSDNLLYKLFNENYIDFNSLNTYEKVLLFTNSFVNVDYYKAQGDELGNYAFNHINVDNRPDIAQQTIILIHELAHHLLAEIFEQAAMILLNTDKTDSIESYVGSSLGSSQCYVLLNEYCAHTVEGRFAPQEYQHYGSFQNNLTNFDLTNEKDNQKIIMAMIIGNTFCQDILTIIEPFMDAYNLKDEIKQQFKNDSNYPPFSPEMIINETVSMNFLLEFINDVLLRGFDEFYNL